MSKWICHIPLTVAVGLAMTMAASASRDLLPRHLPVEPRTGQRVSLEIVGAAGPLAVAEIQRSFAANRVPATVRPGKKNNSPLKLLANIDQNTDLNAWSQAVAAALSNRPGQSPVALELVLYAPITAENETPVLAQLEKMKGVDARHSTVDVKRGVLRVRIRGGDQVTAKDVADAVRKAGVVPRFAK
ncbi:MAG TPA: hypothetical protein VHE81_22630, partial [Lacipirellulaceae bacterium]|nr:hypothetical protein [Lacipirellulaceae bacterium]